MGGPAFGVLSVTLLVVPTLFPWYLLWVLPFMCLLGRRPSAAFVLLTGLVALLYVYYLHDRTFWWTPVLEYVPFYLVLGWEGRHWHRGEGVGTAAPAARPTAAAHLEPSLEA